MEITSFSEMANKCLAVAHGVKLKGERALEIILPSQTAECIERYKLEVIFINAHARLRNQKVLLIFAPPKTVTNIA